MRRGAAGCGGVRRVGAGWGGGVQQMVDFNPDAIVVIGFEESSRIIQGLNAQGIGPQR